MALILGFYNTHAFSHLLTKFIHQNQTSQMLRNSVFMIAQILMLYKDKTHLLVD